jgi:ABC-type Zn uptake system ZnuABC Zn-binding protein ZnuA
MRHILVITGFFAFLFSACGGQPASGPGQAAPVILTSTPLLADVTRAVAGEHVRVESLLGFGVDPHSYQPTPQDVARISESRLIIVNGAEYEHFLESLFESAGGERTIVEASVGIVLREEAESEHGLDPHMWLDPNHMIVYVENIREALTHLDPEGEAVYKTNAEAYAAELHELDSWILEQVGQIPAEKRLLVTNHEAFGYFAERYEFTVVGTVIESFSSNASPSAQQLAGLIDQIRSNGAPAIFLDASDNPTFARQIAEETGVRVITDLHLESLTDGAPAATYIDMMKHNVTQIVNALK